MGVLQIQTDFTHGELSPLMRGRYDTRLYLKSCERLTNMMVLPQGASTRRFGIRFTEKFSAISNQYQLFEFNSIEGQNFLLMLLNDQLRIFEESGTEHPSSPLAFPFPGSLLINSQIKYAQTHDEALFVHPTIQPRALNFNPITNVFTSANFTFKNAPTFDFQDVDYSTAFFTLNVVEPGQAGNITSTVAVFDSEHVGGVILSLGPTADSPLGLGRLTSLVSSTVMTIQIINEFHVNGKAPLPPLHTGFPGNESILEKVAISTTRGWPRSVTFYENRLIFGGSEALPQTLFMSQIADYRDFSVGSANPQDAIVVTISSNKSSNINHLVADRSLQVFTESGEFSPPQLEDTALVPGAMSIRKQSSIGGSARIQPVVIDNNTFYAQKGGRSILAFVYDNNTASYASVESSTISNHLIADVIDMTTLKGRSDSDANFLFLVNGDVVKRIDETLPVGTITSFQTIGEQNIQAWTPIVSKNGVFKRISAVGETLFFIVERTIEGEVLQYLEKADFDLLNDSSLTFSFGSPQIVVSGLDHLEGEEVNIIADGFVVTPQVVQSGQITVENAASVFEIGLDVKTEIRIMPINVSGESGSLLTIPKRIPRYFIDLFESQGVEVNGILIPNLLFSEEFIEDPLPLVSDLFEISNLSGWDRRQTITLTQNGPFKMTVLGIGYEVDL